MEKQIEIHNTLLPEVKLIQPQIFEDERGFFYESFNQNKFNDALGFDIEFVQDNHSLSKYGVLRGLHFQEDPHAQGKLVRVTRGEVFDVAVDVRKNSKNYGRWVGKFLSDKNKSQLWIPGGFAHGFLVLSEVAEFQYKTTNFYNPSHERCIIFNDSLINIEWPKLSIPFLINDKDLSGIHLEEY